MYNFIEIVRANYENWEGNPWKKLERRRGKFCETIACKILHYWVGNTRSMSGEFKAGELIELKLHKMALSICACTVVMLKCCVKTETLWVNTVGWRVVGCVNSWINRPKWSLWELITLWSVAETWRIFHTSLIHSKCFCPLDWGNNTHFNVDWTSIAVLTFSKLSVCVAFGMTNLTFNLKKNTKLSLFFIYSLPLF